MAATSVVLSANVSTKPTIIWSPRSLYLASVGPIKLDTCSTDAVMLTVFGMSGCAGLKATFSPVGVTMVSRVLGVLA